MITPLSKLMESFAQRASGPEDLTTKGISRDTAIPEVACAEIRKQMPHALVAHDETSNSISISSGGDTALFRYEFKQIPDNEKTWGATIMRFADEESLSAEQKAQTSEVYEALKKIDFLLLNPAQGNYRLLSPIRLEQQLKNLNPSDIDPLVLMKSCPLTGEYTVDYIKGFHATGTALVLEIFKRQERGVLYLSNMPDSETDVSEKSALCGDFIKCAVHSHGISLEPDQIYEARVIGLKSQIVPLLPKDSSVFQDRNY